MSDTNWIAIRADYEAGGMSLRQLADKYGVSKSTIGERKFTEQWDNPKKRTADTKQRTADSEQAQVDTDLTAEKDTSTKEKQRLFLEAFAEHANVLVSARAAGISRQIVYTWLEHDEDFSFAYHQAKEDAKDVLRDEIYRRGKEGWEEDVYSFGKFQGTVRKYDTTLLIFHAKMLMPEYRDKQQVDVTTHTNAKNEQAYENAIMKALEPYPEAKWALAEALAELEKTSK